MSKGIKIHELTKIFKSAHIRHAQISLDQALVDTLVVNFDYGFMHGLDVMSGFGKCTVQISSSSEKSPIVSFMHFVISSNNSLEYTTLVNEFMDRIPKDIYGYKLSQFNKFNDFIIALICDPKSLQ